MPRAYLAGPEVFLPDPHTAAAAKKAICAKHGLEGLFPLDAGLDLTGLASRDAALRIAAANEALMRGADLIVANLTPFHGIGADPGTAYEVGFMRALGKPVFAYSNEAAPLLDRARAQLAGGAIRDPAGRWRARDGMELEDFGLADNLMLEGAAAATGGGTILTGETAPQARWSDMTAFERAIAAAARWFRTAGLP